MTTSQNNKGYQPPSEEWMRQWLEEMKAAMANSENEPDIVDELPEYIPLPTASDEVVAVVFPTQAKGNAPCAAMKRKVRKTT